MDIYFIRRVVNIFHIPFIYFYILKFLTNAQRLVEVMAQVYDNSINI